MDTMEFTDDSVEVELTRDTRANGPRLRVEDRSTGEVAYLDPLEIECLTRVPDGRLDDYVS